MSGTSHVMVVDGRDITVTNTEKLYFPKRDLTKGDIIDYFLEVADPLLNAMRDRPILLQRFPNGAGGKSFFQKRIPDSAPEWLQTDIVETVNGTPSRVLVMADAAHLVWAVNQGAFVLHPWPFRLPSRDVDELRVDLDPTPGITFDDVRHVASLVKDELERAGITSWIKTSGSKGLHIFVPVGAGWDSYKVRGAAVTLARRLAARHPEEITDAWWKEERGRRVFVDFNQNAPHKTVFGAWSVRARVGAQVSTPIGWDELETVESDALTVETVPQRLKDLGDPWASMYDSPQNIDDLVAEFDANLTTIGDAPWPPVYPKQPFEPPRVAPSRAKSES